MDWSKLDTELAGTLTGSGGSSRYAVFVHLTADAGADVLAELGVETAGDGRIRTATLSASEVELLSDQDWVSRLTASSTLGLAGDG